ncbi:hypothetical protein [Microcoleus sp. D3_18a_C4]|uniref:hypothetical protein n=1 Tax=Microcoleus sp. D3_18a_C4 TaxID=3055332 RepID=UPI002FD6E2E9
MRKNIRFVGSSNRSPEIYYDLAALSSEDFAFLSPINLPDWCLKTAKWLSKSSRIGEIGVGKGKLACLTIQCASNDLYFALIDISSNMLDVTEKNIGHLKKSFVTTRSFKLDISTKTEINFLDDKLDKLIAVNVLQDVEINQSLTNMRALLNKGSEIRLTFISKETQDDFLKDDPNYDSSEGIIYASSSFHKEKQITPLGFFKDKEGGEEPFYRINRCYKHDDICNLLEKNSFELKTIEPIIYPTHYLWQRWKSRYYSISLTERQFKLIEDWGGYPDGWDVIATAI